MPFPVGDVVQRAGSGFRGWGRTHACIASGDDGARRWRLGPRQVADAPAAEPGVARMATRPCLKAVSGAQIGPPAFTLRPGEAVGEPPLPIHLTLAHGAVRSRDELEAARWVVHLGTSRSSAAGPPVGRRP